MKGRHSIFTDRAKGRETVFMNGIILNMQEY